MRPLFDRWTASLIALPAILAGSLVAGFQFQAYALERLNIGFSGDLGSEDQLEYSRVSAAYFLVSQATPILVFVTGIAIATLLVVLSRRWNLRENALVRRELEGE